MQKTWMAKSSEEEEIERDWYLADASRWSLGRIASRIAKILQGKNKPIYTPHVDVGDHVVVVNAAEVRITGNKLEDKYYYEHSGYLGNMKESNLEELLEEEPTTPIKEAVRRMLPKNKQARKMLKRLKVYPDADHPHGDIEFKEVEK